MAVRPLVTIVTPTVGRPSIAQAIESIKAQTYDSIEHIIVADGPQAAAKLDGLQPIVLGRQWTNASTGPGHYAMNVGWLLARGEYLFELCDDDTLDPRAVEMLMVAIQDSGADFAYSKVWMTGRYGEWLCGAEPCGYGTITNFLFHHSLLSISPYIPVPGMDPDHPRHDADMIERWLANGAKPVFVPEILQTHRVDH